MTHKVAKNNYYHGSRRACSVIEDLPADIEFELSQTDRPLSLVKSS